MTTEKRIGSIEGELKLLKTEVKQSLTDIHDFLIAVKIPLPATDNLDMVDDNRLKVDGRVNVGSEAGAAPSPPQDTIYKIGGNENMDNVQHLPEQKNLVYGATPPAGPPVATAAEAPGEKEPAPPLPGVKLTPVTAPVPEPEASAENRIPQPGGNIPQVNMLANLVRWVSAAKSSIGAENIRVFLDVYGATGNLPAETRNVILELGEMVSEPATERSGDSWSRVFKEQLNTLLEMQNGQLSAELKECLLRFTRMVIAQSREPDGKADTWSRMMLELHGILNGGGGQLQYLPSDRSGLETKEREPVKTESPAAAGISGKQPGVPGCLGNGRGGSAKWKT